MIFLYFFLIFNKKDLKMARTPTVDVKGYRKKDGTKVKPHKRTPPDRICENNLKPKNCKKK